MTDPETIPADVHEEVELLPWYANSTLCEADQLRVAQHMESCQECRRELDALVRLQADLAVAYEAQPGPPPQLARSVLAAMAPTTQADKDASMTDGSWLDVVDQWFRSLFLPKWVPTLAAALLVAQLALLLWLGAPPADQTQITTRSLAMPTTKMIIVFHEFATEAQIRSSLQSVRGRIIDGPAPDGGYTVEVPATDESAARQKLDTLQGRTDIIRSVVRTIP